MGGIRVIRGTGVGGGGGGGGIRVIRGTGGSHKGDRWEVSESYGGQGGGVSES